MGDGDFVVHVHQIQFQTYAFPKAWENAGLPKMAAQIAESSCDLSSCWRHSLI